MVAESSHWYFRVVILNSRGVYSSVQTTFPPEIVCLNHSSHFSAFNETRQWVGGGAAFAALWSTFPRPSGDTSRIGCGRSLVLPMIEKNDKLYVLIYYRVFPR